MSSRPPAFVIFLFASFWSAITSLFLFFAIYGVVNQYRTLSFATTRGTVDKIDQTSSTDDEGTSYGIKIAYHYRVDRKRYDSTRLRFHQMSFSDNWASTMLHRFSARSHPTVYYNPANPGESTLIRGIEGEDLFLLLFLTPFTLIGLMLWTFFFRTLFQQSSLRAFNIREQGATTIIRPSLFRVAVVGGIVLGASAFLSIFVVAFLFGGLHPSLKIMMTLWSVLLALAALAMLVTAFLQFAGRLDIILDDSQQLLVARKRRVSYNAITGVHVFTPAATAGSKSQNTTFAVAVTWKTRQRRR